MLHVEQWPGGTVLGEIGRWAGRSAGPVLAALAVGGVLLGAAVVGHGIQGAPHLSNYVPDRSGTAQMGFVAGLPAALPAAPAPTPAPATGGLRVVANPNIAKILANVDANTPDGPPLARTDWVITKDYAAHGGHSNTGAVDFAILQNKDAPGSLLLATHAGKVKLLQNDPTYGNLVYVIGPHYTTTYGHMQKFYVKDGDQVVRGTVLGEMGSTGHSTGPHVDYQVWRDGANQDPMDYGIPGVQGAGPSD